ncbi:MarR family winged helix-turn-helix transcriptional regulator [Pasteurella testudinis]|uniref:MarR family winged helix-turn-helix transcriptional regulator n=1 Tax=Pasteurella testudinis TaxID=761 RepID=UPI0040599419
MHSIYNLDELDSLVSEIDHLHAQWVKQNGLNYNHFAVLYSLATEGQYTQQQICQDWLLPKQTVFNVCKAFRQSGMVQMHSNPANGRERILQLTAAGKAKALPVVAAHQALSERLFEEFGAEQSEQLFDLLQQFLQLFKHTVAQDAGQERRQERS